MIRKHRSPVLTYLPQRNKPPHLQLNSLIEEAPGIVEFSLKE
jgi:hypothetical protein